MVESIRSTTIGCTSLCWTIVMTMMVMMQTSIHAFSIPTPRRKTTIPITPLHQHPSSEDSLTAAAQQHTLATSSLIGTKSLGVDYGLLRTGLALTVGYDPQPLSIVSHLSQTELCTHIVQLVDTHSVSQVVLGYPVHANGTMAEQTQLTAKFATQLKCSLYAHFGPTVPLWLWDERYTSRAAEANALAKDPKANVYKQLDADAAGLILEDYYQEGGIGAMEVSLPEGDEMEAIRKSVELAWETKRREIKSKEEEYWKERENSLNAKQRAMERARLMEKELARQGVLPSSSKKKKKKKKKKK